MTSISLKPLHDVLKHHSRCLSIVFHSEHFPHPVLPENLSTRPVSSRQINQAVPFCTRLSSPRLNEFQKTRADQLALRFFRDARNKYWQAIYNKGSFVRGNPSVCNAGA